MAKRPFLHQISCRVNQQAQLSTESKRAMNYVPVGRNCQKERIGAVANLGKSNLHRISAISTRRCRVDISYTDFEALAAVWAFGPLRFSRKLANMALARAGKSR